MIERGVTGVCAREERSTRTECGASGGGDRVVVVVVVVF